MDIQTGCGNHLRYGERKIPGIGQLQEGLLQLGDRKGAVFGAIHLDPGGKDEHPEERGQIHL